MINRRFDIVTTCSGDNDIYINGVKVNKNIKEEEMNIIDFEKPYLLDWKKRNDIETDPVYVDKARKANSATGIMVHLKDHGSEGWFDLSYFEDSKGLRDIRTRVNFLVIENIVEEKIKHIYEFKEKYVEAFIAETGLKPSECEIVIRDKGFEEIFYVRKKQDEINIKESNKLIEAYEEYVELLKEEIGELVPIAHTHGWSSNKIKKGIELRKRISDLK